MFAELVFVKFNIILNISLVFRIVGLVGSLRCGIYLQVLAQRWKALTC